MFITVIKNRRLNTDFMPLTAITALEFEPILEWIKSKYKGSDVFKRGIFYEDVLPTETDNLYEAGADFLGDEEVFKTALYEQKRLKPF